MSWWLNSWSVSIGLGRASIEGPMLTTSGGLEGKRSEKSWSMMGNFTLLKSPFYCSSKLTSCETIILLDTSLKQRYPLIKLSYPNSTVFNSLTPFDPQLIPQFFGDMNVCRTTNCSKVEETWFHADDALRWCGLLNQVRVTTSKYVIWHQYQFMPKDGWDIIIDG